MLPISLRECRAQDLVELYEKKRNCIIAIANLKTSLEIAQCPLMIFEVITPGNTRFFVNARDLTPGIELRLLIAQNKLDEIETEIANLES